VVLVAPSDQDGVITDREGVDMDELVVDDQAHGKFIPCGGVQTDARDGAEVPGQHVDEVGQLRADVAGTRPPRAIEVAFPGSCRLQPQKNCPASGRSPGARGTSDSVMVCPRLSAGFGVAAERGTSSSHRKSRPPHRLRAGGSGLVASVNACSRARSGSSERRRVKGPGVLRTPAVMSMSFPASTTPASKRRPGDRSVS
jgi:hypothetical protein